jgi:hypothetical protein
MAGLPPQAYLQMAQVGFELLNKNNEAKAQEARYQQNRINAVAARDLKIQALNTRAIQEVEAVAEDKMALAIKALETKESQKVAAGEAGVSGKSVKQQIDLTEARKLRGMDKYNANIENILTQIELEKTGLNAEALNSINALQRGVQPSLGAAIVKGASAAATASVKYGDGKLFGMDLLANKNVTNLVEKGTYGDLITPLIKAPPFSITST